MRTSCSSRGSPSSPNSMVILSFEDVLSSDSFGFLDLELISIIRSCNLVIGLNMVARTNIQGDKVTEMACPFFLVADLIKISTAPITNRIIRVTMRAFPMLIPLIAPGVNNKTDEIKHTASAKVLNMVNADTY